MMIAPRAERVGEIGQQWSAAVLIGMLLDPRGDTRRVGAERRLGSRGDDERPGPFARHFSWVPMRRMRRLSEQNVCIRAAEAERVHAGEPDSFCLRERLGLCDNP